MQPDRYALDVVFPAYAFVPGKNAHPVTDPHGHSFGNPHIVPDPLDPQFPTASKTFLTAIDLFNSGYYWEAHEAWEGLWIAAGRTGAVADFLKGLIKLAAAGVKAREGKTIGVQRHATRAAELFLLVRKTLTQDQKTFAGLSFDRLIAAANSLATNPIVDESSSVGGRPVLAIWLTLQISTKTAE